MKTVLLSCHYSGEL